MKFSELLINLFIFLVLNEQDGDHDVFCFNHFYPLNTQY